MEANKPLTLESLHEQVSALRDRCKALPKGHSARVYWIALEDIAENVEYDIAGEKADADLRADMARADAANDMARDDALMGSAS